LIFTSNRPMQRFLKLGGQVTRFLGNDDTEVAS
jgi:hypothetical protein